MSKYLMEKLFEEYHSSNLNTFIEFGNVAWSNGSVLPFWLNVKNQMSHTNNRFRNDSSNFYI